jgi:hypothetical protein
VEKLKMNAMENKKLLIEDLHFEHRVWGNALTFYKQEIELYEKRLEELVLKYDDQQMLSNLEHFQNQFIRHKEVVHNLLHEIHRHEAILANFAENNKADNLHHTHFEYHEHISDQMKTFKKLYSEMKEEFWKFSAKWK